ncbi:MAG: hypothetical protein AAGF74_11915 [Pseudomonadota bacterium]
MSSRRTPPAIWLVGLPLAWLGLAGLVDGAVIWKDWFETGVMEVWRNAKAWMGSFAPFDIPSWVFDYLVFCILPVRAILLSLRHEPRPEPKEVPPWVREELDRARVLHNVQSVLLTPVLVVTMPLIILVRHRFLYAYFLRRPVSEKVKRVIPSVGHFWLTILTFIPVLIFLTEEMPFIESFLGFGAPAPG